MYGSGLPAVRTTRIGSRPTNAPATWACEAKISGCSGASTLSCRMSSTTPTISQPALASRKRRARPSFREIASLSDIPSRYFRTNDRLTTTAGGAVAVSAAVKGRPATIRSRSAAKYSGLTIRRAASTWISVSGRRGERSLKMA